jgi:hypothetical protein
MCSEARRKELHDTRGIEMEGTVSASNSPEVWMYVRWPAHCTRTASGSRFRCSNPWPRALRRLATYNEFLGGAWNSSVAAAAANPLFPSPNVAGAAHLAHSRRLSLTVGDVHLFQNVAGVDLPGCRPHGSLERRTCRLLQYVGGVETGRTIKLSMKNSIMRS